MSEPTISYDGTHYFNTTSGHIFAYDSDFDAIIGPADAFDKIRLDDLVVAMREARDNPAEHSVSDNHWMLSGQDEPWNEYEPSAEGNYSFRLGEAGTIELTISTHRWLEPEGDELSRISAILKPQCDRLGIAAFARANDPVFGTDAGAIEILVPHADRTGADLRRLALESEALVAAVLSHEFSLSAAADIVRAGLSEALIGQREQSWLEAKRAPYQLEHDTQKLELAKDVAAFANTTAGGLIIIGATTVKEQMGDTIGAINDIPLNLIDLVQYRDVLRDRIFPQIDGLDVGIVEHTEGRGVAYIHIQPQPPTKLPFLVRGAEVDGKVTTAYVSIPTRDGEDTRYVTIGELHSLLSAGRASLAFVPPVNSGD